MNTLERQLADYGDRQRELHGPLTTDELIALRSLVASNGTAVDSAQSEITMIHEAVFDLRHPGERVAPAPRKRRVMVSAAVAAAVLLVVGIVVADRNDGNVVTDAVSSPRVVEPAPPLAVADPGSSLWSLVSYESGTGLSSVVAGGPGFVAVGGRDGNAAVWTSVDGLTWSRVPHDEAVFGGDGESGMAAVAVGGPGLVAVGQQYVCTDLEARAEDPVTVCADRNAVVWTSVDGLTWSRVPHDEAVFGGQDFHQMNSVAPGGPGLVAVGRSDDFGGRDVLVEGETAVEVDAVVWTSVDGLTWSRVPHDEAVFGGMETQDMLDVTTGGPGLVAVGQDGGFHFWGNSAVERPGVWTSADGLSWTRIAHDEDAFARNSAMLGVTAGGPGLVAVGHGGDWVSRVWTSVDGVIWSRVVHDNEAEMGEYMSGVAAGGPGLVAVGRDKEEAVWTSPDGLTWSPAPNIAVPQPGP